MLPAKLQDVVDEFAGLPPELQLETLLDYSRMVPSLPPHLSAADLERVHECQTPFFAAVEIADDQTVTLHFDAPPEAPTTRGFAGILIAGLSGESAEAVLATPNDFYTKMGLAGVISPLRLRGMSAILARVKRQIRVRLAAA
ncbi:MAG: SufE family protein [Egibacteraceae bacterium]